MITSLLILHLVCCVLVFCLSRLHRLRSGGAILLLVLLVPLFGLGCLLTAEVWARGSHDQTERIDLDEQFLTDELYKSIPAAPSMDAEKIVPIEESLLLNHPLKRRYLLLILNRDPAAFVSQLRLAGQNDDTEVVHYAVTALMELRNDFGNRLNELDQAWKRAPGDVNLIRQYAELEESYLACGLPVGSERTEKLRHYSGLLQTLGRETEQNGGDLLPLLRKQAEAAMALRDYSQAEVLNERIIQLTPEDESGYLNQIKCYAARRDRPGIDTVLRLLEQRSVLLSAAGENAVRFWSGQ